MPEFVFGDVTREDYEKSSSKFVTFPPGSKPGDTITRGIKIGALDWETAGKSMRVPVEVIQEGPDQGKTDKMVFGVGPTAIWKGKEIYSAVTGKEMPFKTDGSGVERPVITQEELLDKPATGLWRLMTGKKGGDPDGEEVEYPKLESILAPAVTE